MLQSIKNAKRRAAQNILKKLGRAESTVDPEFDASHEREFLKIIIIIIIKNCVFVFCIF